MKQVYIKDLLDVINQQYPKCFYSIMDIDAYMPRAILDNGNPSFFEIDKDIKNLSTGYTTDYATLSKLASQFDDVKDMFFVVNKKKAKPIPFSESECQKFIDNSLAIIAIEDLDLVELYCSDDDLRNTIISKLGNLPLRVNCSPYN